MDPNATLAQLRQFVNEVNELIDDEDQTEEKIEQIVNHTIDITDLFKALDDWISRGGFLPTAWVQPTRRKDRK